MARPLKRRNICSLPESNRFGPLNTHRDPKETVRMTVDEYEAIRLIDLEGFTQEECAEQMGVARSTVQGIYLEARKKLAEVLVNGKLLFIEGGEYRLCEGSGTACGRACRRHRLGLCFATEKTVRPDPNTNERRTPMKITIPVEENTLDAKVSSSFGRAAYFLIFDTQSDEARFIDNPAINSTGGAGILSAQTVVDAGADTLLTPRLGQNAADVIQDAGMQVFQSKEGTAKENIEACCAKTLKVLEEIHEGFHGHGNRE